MGVFEHFPYVNFHELNLDWIIRTITDLKENLRSMVEEIIRELRIPEKLSERRFIFIADSYGMRVEPSYTTLLMQYLDLTSGENGYNISKSGAGFARPGNTFLNHLISEAANIDDHETITDIVVGGGFNDANMIRSGAITESVLLSAIETFCNYCKNEYPNAKIWVHFDGWANSVQATGIGSVGEINYYLYRAEQMYASSGRYGAAYMSNIKYSLHDTALMDETYFHPNETGNVILASNIMSYLMGGSSSTTDLKQIDYTENSDISLSTGKHIYQSIENGMIRMFFGDIGASAASIVVSPKSGDTTFSLSMGVQFKICDLDLDEVMMIGDKRTSCTVTALAKDASDILHPIPVTIQYYNGGIYISQYTNIASYKLLVLRPFELVYNTMLADMGSYGS